VAGGAETPLAQAIQKSQPRTRDLCSMTKRKSSSPKSTALRHPVRTTSDRLAASPAERSDHARLSSAAEEISGGVETSALAVRSFAGCTAASKRRRPRRVRPGRPEAPAALARPASIALAAVATPAAASPARAAVWINANAALSDLVLLDSEVGLVPCFRNPCARSNCQRRRRGAVETAPPRRTRRLRLCSAERTTAWRTYPNLLVLDQSRKVDSVAVVYETIKCRSAPPKCSREHRQPTQS
jgi:hypothetical protein